MQGYGSLLSQHFIHTSSMIDRIERDFATHAVACAGTKTEERYRKKLGFTTLGQANGFVKTMESVIPEITCLLAGENVGCKFLGYVDGSNNQKDCYLLDQKYIYTFDFPIDGGKPQFVQMSRSGIREPLPVIVWKSRSNPSMGPNMFWNLSLSVPYRKMKDYDYSKRVVQFSKKAKLLSDRERSKYGPPKKRRIKVRVTCRHNHCGTVCCNL